MPGSGQAQGSLSSPQYSSTAPAGGLNASCSHLRQITRRVIQRHCQVEGGPARKSASRDAAPPPRAATNIISLPTSDRPPVIQRHCQVRGGRRGKLSQPQAGNSARAGGLNASSCSPHSDKKGRQVIQRVPGGSVARPRKPQPALGATHRLGAATNASFAPPPPTKIRRLFNDICQVRGVGLAGKPQPARCSSTASRAATNASSCFPTATKCSPGWSTTQPGHVAYEEASAGGANASPRRPPPTPRSALPLPSASLGYSTVGV